MHKKKLKNKITVHSQVDTNTKQWKKKKKGGMCKDTKSDYLPLIEIKLQGSHASQCLTSGR